MRISSSILIISWFLCMSLELRVQCAEFSTGLRNATTTSEELNIRRSDFPSDFVFGVATAAAQRERTKLWDYFVRKFPERIQDHSSNRRALDHYKRYKEDGKLIKDLGVDSYRFSIPWTKILPKGSLSGEVKQEGIDHYNILIDELLKNGIKTFVTLLHFDTPQVLQEKHGGPLNRSFVDDFKNYAELCFKIYGDRVKHWFTINEPFMGAAIGLVLVRLHQGDVPLALLNVRQVKQGREIGICHVEPYAEPYSLVFVLMRSMEPLVFGDYPKNMRDLVKDRLPYFTQEEKNLIKGSFDFIGINYYTARYVKSAPPDPNAPAHYMADSLAEEQEEKDGVPIGPHAEGSMFIYIYPMGLEKLLNFMKDEYDSPKIYISENGIIEANIENVKLEEALRDTHRIKNTLRHLFRIHNAIKNGVKVEGYVYRSLFDNFEWEEGYIPRFELCYIDFNNDLKRIPKLSLDWYRGFLRGSYSQAYSM